MLFIAIAKVRRETLTDVKSLKITVEWIEKWEGAKKPVNGVRVIYAYASVACPVGAVMLLEAEDEWKLSEFFSPIVPYNEVTISPVVEFAKEVRQGLRRSEEQAQRK